MTQAGHILFLGLGYVAGQVARRLEGRGWRISGTARDEAALAAIRARGWRGWLFDGTAPLPAEAWEGVAHVLSSVPPVLPRGTAHRPASPSALAEEGACIDPVLAALGGQLRARASMLEWVGYLSTVGVYGDHGGAWVDEETPPRPVSVRGRCRLEAERAWLALHDEAGLPVHIFRLPGIYGPGRGPLEKARQAARKALVVRPGQVFSRIHVDDLADALLASMARPHPGRIYNVTDDEAAPPHEVALFAHRLLGLAPPPLVPFEEAELSPMARSFYGESKRVSNRRLKEELGWKPRHATYREGLQALLEREESRRCGRGEAS